MIDPVLLPTSPRIDFRVDVRPAPFLPRSVTTSPLCTVRSTPCSTWDSPYHACRLEMRRTSLAMRGPHVRLHHLRIGGNLGVGAFGELGAALQHGDRVADAGDHAHVVLHHEHGAPDGDLLDEVAHAVHVLVAHARGGLVEEHELRLHR